MQNNSEVKSQSMTQPKNSVNNQQRGNQKQLSPKKKEKHTKNLSPSNPGQKESRNAKRRRWAKKNKATKRSSGNVHVAPVNEYISVCCSLPARKPYTGQKETMKDPETGKMVNQAKGLGKWRCTGCGKLTKVTRRKPQSKEIPNGTEEQTTSNVNS